jgi:hypothetical protein
MRLSKIGPILLAGATVAVVPAARATPIVYTESDFLRVTIGASAQLVGTLTISLTADTSTVTSLGGGVLANTGTVNFSFNAGVSGVFAGTFTDAVRVFDNQTAGVAGFTDVTFLVDIVNTPGTAFDTYGLTTFLAPVTGKAFVPFGDEFPTSVGTLKLLSSPQDINNSTFSASAVPEPATLTMLTAGLLSLTRIRRRRAR